MICPLKYHYSISNDSRPYLERKHFEPIFPLLHSEWNGRLKIFHSIAQYPPPYIWHEYLKLVNKLIICLLVFLMGFSSQYHWQEFFRVESVVYPLQTFGKKSKNLFAIIVCYFCENFWKLCFPENWSPESKGFRIFHKNNEL